MTSAASAMPNASRCERPSTSSTPGTTASSAGDGTEAGSLRNVCACTAASVSDPSSNSRVVPGRMRSPSRSCMFLRRSKTGSAAREQQWQKATGVAAEPNPASLVSGARGQSPPAEDQRVAAETVSQR
ncbi:hypothetical protein ON010_g10735 [Phytophthora cinnamomi]|nr:hypothetical protein ON010_g10735 [Phytophthora cinnamomi]